MTDLPIIDEILPERDWFRFKEKGEQMQVPSMLARIGEGNVCLVSGETPVILKDLKGNDVKSMELIDYPIDHNVQNILLTNMATVDRKSLSHPMKCFGYVLESLNIRAEIVTNAELKEHNEAYWDSTWKFDITGENILGLWDFLTRNHIKGLTKIVVGDYYLTVNEALGYAYRKLKTIETETSLSLI